MIRRHPGDGLNDVIAFGPLVVGNHSSPLTTDRLIPTVLPREETGGQGEVGHEPHTELGRHLPPGARAFDVVSVEKVVVGLKDDGPCVPVCVSDGEPLTDALRRVVGQPHVPDPAGESGLFEGADGLLQRSRLIVEVGVVDINDVGTQSRQRLLQRPADVIRAQTRTVGLRGDLRGKNHALTDRTRGEPGTDHGLRLPS